MRQFSAAAGIRDKFEDAWQKKAAERKEVIPKAKNLDKYGASYYQKNIHRLKKGYEHPYNSKDYPLLFTDVHKMSLLWNSLIGPEQVSPHYESLSRSRRIILFVGAYLTSIYGISALGGWEYNEWFRQMLLQHEFIIAFFLGYVEIRHFAFLPGPKFTPFYQTFARYEYSQLLLGWQDLAEENTNEFLKNSREQIEYMRIHEEYRFIKKRSLLNYLTNSRLNLEKHFHDRSVAMLRNIKRFEADNMNNRMKRVTSEAMEDTLKRARTEPQVKRQAFLSALDGIRNNKMTYSNDPVLPILREEILKRTADIKNMTPEQENKLLSLTEQQRNLIAQADSTSKVAFTSHVPNVHSPSLKATEKFRKFEEAVAHMK